MPDDDEARNLQRWHLKGILAFFDEVNEIMYRGGITADEEDDEEDE